MESLESSQGLLETFEHLRKVIQYRREDLLSTSLYELTTNLIKFLTFEPRLYFNELFLEILCKLSYSLYIKSSLLLNLPPPKGEEEPIGEVNSRERFFYLYQAIPLGRLLEEKVFLPKVNGFEIHEDEEKKGDILQLIRALLDVLDRIQREPTMTIDLNTPSIEDYLEKLKDSLEKYRIATWEELIQRLNLTGIMDRVYLFLAVLFLVFEGVCGVHQEEEGTIHIFLKA